MGDLQDPKIEVLYRISAHILLGYSRKKNSMFFRPEMYGFIWIYMVGSSNQSVPVGQ